MSKQEKVVKAQEIIANITKGLNDLVELLITDKLVEEHPAAEQKRKRRDPNAPKPPTSNFFLFTNSIRDEVEKENPDATFAEKSKIYGARWQQLSSEAKQPFTDIAKEEREKYNKELAAYEAKVGNDVEEHTEKKAKKETAAPKTAAPKTAAPKTAAPKTTTPKTAATAKAAKADGPAKTATKAAATKAAKTEKPAKVTEKPAAAEPKTKAAATKAAAKPAKAAAVTAKPTAAKPAAKKPVESSTDSDSDDSSSTDSDSDSD